MQRKGRWCACGGVNNPRPPPAVTFPSAVPVSPRSCESSHKLQDFLHQPCTALGQLPKDHWGWWRDPQGVNGEEHKHGSMLTARMFVQEVDAWIPVVSILFVRQSEEHAQEGLKATWVLLGEWKPIGQIPWGGDVDKFYPNARRWEAVVTANTLYQHQSSLFSAGPFNLPTASRKVLLNSGGTGCSLGRTTHPPDPDLDGGRLGCRCPPSNKTCEQGDWADGSYMVIVVIMVILTEWCKAELITKLLKKISTDVWRAADTDSKICMKITWISKWSGCIKIVISNLINLLFFLEKELSLTLGTGFLWWEGEEEEDLLTQLYSRAVASSSFSLLV